jgi:hypothetical protein
MEVALAVLQVRVALCPDRTWIVAGEAVNRAVGGVAVTVTTAVLVTVWPLPVAVSVYVVVCEGETIWVPLGATAPIPLLIETEVALAVFQVRVALWPLGMDAGETVNCAVGAVAVTVTLAVLVMVFAPLAAVSV